MAKRVTILFLLLLCSISLIDAEKVYAESFFMDCEAAFKLKDFFDKHLDKPRPDQSFRLNNSEFLVIITDTGSVGQGLYFVNVKNNKMEIDDGYALMGVKKEFFGKNQKRYVLLATANLGSGSYSNGYSILNLIPRHNVKPYILYLLFDVSEDPIAGLCGEKRDRFIKDHIKAEAVDSYKILNEDTENVTLVFYIIEENCETLKKRTYAKRFKLVDGIFKQVE